MAIEIVKPATSTAFAGERNGEKRSEAGTVEHEETREVFTFEPILSTGTEAPCPGTKRNWNIIHANCADSYHDNAPRRGAKAGRDCFFARS